jgi:hypothetical protein
MQVIVASLGFILNKAISPNEEPFSSTFTITIRVPPDPYKFKNYFYSKMLKFFYNSTSLFGILMCIPT